MGPRFEAFMHDHKLDDYTAHFRMLGVAFERDLVDITDGQLTLLQDRHGLKVLDRRRFDKAVTGLRRRLDSGGQDEDQDSAERHHIRPKKEDGAAQASMHTKHTGRLPGGIIKNVTFVTDVMENT